MNIDDGVWNGLKHIWELCGVAVSALFSWVAYRYRKHQHRLEEIEKTHYEHATLIKVFEAELHNLAKDLDEIKSDLKKILYKM